MQRTVDRYVGTLLCRLFSLLPFGRPRVDTKPKRILIILLSEMGSLVLAYPMMKYLTERYPSAELYALVFNKNREVLDLLEIVKKTNVLTIRADSTVRFFHDSAKTIYKLRMIGVDLVIDCELFARVTSLISLFSGAPVKVGFHPYNQEGLYRGDFIDRPVPYNPYLHISRQFLNLAYAVEGHTVPNSKQPFSTKPLVVSQKQFSASEVNSYSAKLKLDFPQIRERRLVLVYPSGGILSIRAWPVDKFCQLCTALEKDGFLVGVIGLQSDQILGQQIVESAGSEFCINLTGYTQTIHELLLLFRQAELLVTNDGGPGHFGALVDIPSIVLFGPESPQLYKPISSNVFCFYNQLACSPCLTAFNHRDSPCDGDNQCLKRISLQEVLDKSRSMLAITR